MMETMMETMMKTTKEKITNERLCKQNARCGIKEKYGYLSERI